MDLTPLIQGAEAPKLALLLNRVALGAFFAISGYHKLFNASRHAALVRTLQDDDVPALPIMQWLLPSAEFSGGCALILGFLAVPAACGLLIICIGALCLDGVRRMSTWRTLDRADWLGDLLYVPEMLYCIGLTVILLAGPGPWSLDARLLVLLAR
jgi:uncharacterized membrane protein YphA (DoxX/SURF4 family)